MNSAHAPICQETNKFKFPFANRTTSSSSSGNNYCHKQLQQHYRAATTLVTVACVVATSLLLGRCANSSNCHTLARRSDQFRLHYLRLLPAATLRWLGIRRSVCFCFCCSVLRQWMLPVLSVHFFFKRTCHTVSVYASLTSHRQHGSQFGSQSSVAIVSTGSVCWCVCLCVRVSKSLAGNTDTFGFQTNPRFVHIASATSSGRLCNKLAPTLELQQW